MALGNCPVKDMLQDEDELYNSHKVRRPQVGPCSHLALLFFRLGLSAPLLGCSEVSIFSASDATEPMTGVQLLR